MESKEFEQLGTLFAKYRKATSPCDPLEFMKRQQELLYALADTALLYYLEENFRIYSHKQIEEEDVE